MICPLCGYEFDATRLGCYAACPLAMIQKCHLVCCPNCGYQMVDEDKSGAVRLLRQTWKTLKALKPLSEEE